MSSSNSGSIISKVRLLDKLDVLVEGEGKMPEVLENEARRRENFRSVTPWFLAEPIASNTE